MNFVGHILINLKDRIKSFLYALEKKRYKIVKVINEIHQIL